ncbi:MULTISPECIES: DUF6167 family protein [Streptomyces]|uniref:Secreted protein n=1 Tax=Streptomyces tsukubensis (strain DSM 42081 / NBRC 108919 / NRRL 18488 / 9993) TaxID=1114943 RepID=I2MV98_STRT9|nr:MULTISPECIES: DUF6167 family protein [Streptomyces]AZK93169.1 hypothetical protein B7R87_04245 [Streptomyces tsukubensis]EIF88695.1 hypothetical protein [Streptomyces tsukubensis NRRL18488]MYS63077.1 hypothetical protein [Streptomyces sp. SID5473]QKM70667.1 hypothetical protein STSU_029575 [Streptomyces tsukubensis NRRL18488]TAI41239.1 hypothetical protein EWI31_28120 [Streptomyces tsukubensis]
MFRRTFWFTAGAAAGVWATTKVNRKIQQLTPESLAAQAAGRAVDAGHRLREFALDVRAGMIQREEELGEALGTSTPPGTELPAQRARPALGGPARGPRAAHPNRPHTSYNRNEDH